MSLVLSRVGPFGMPGCIGESRDMSETLPQKQRIPRSVRIFAGLFLAIAIFLTARAGWRAYLRFRVIADFRQRRITVKVGRTPPVWLTEALGEDLADSFSPIEQIKIDLQDTHNYPRITDAECRYFDNLGSLRSLSLRGAKITDAGLAHLQGLKNLESLRLASTPITDAGLEYLAGLSKLKSLSLEETHVTAAGIEKLQRALPHTTIGPPSPFTPPAEVRQ
jgi:hypothetical protein